VALLLALAGCTVHHSKQAMRVDDEPSSAATFVSEEDGGLALFGFLTLSEPDHFAVLMARAERRYRCAKLTNPQLDFFTDHWIIISFPIARVTAVCEPQPDGAPTPIAPVRTSTVQS
jgi:hypothetical protein